MKVLIAYASVHGSTAEIAEFIRRVLETYNIAVTSASVKDVKEVRDYDAVILGSAIHAGMWLTEMYDFMQQFKEDIRQKASYLFITNIRQLEEGGYEHAMENYVHKQTLEELKLHHVIAFAGRLELSVIDWNERWLLGVQYDGAALPGTFNHDYRDWETIGTWANKIAKELGAKPTFSPVNSTASL